MIYMRSMSRDISIKCFVVASTAVFKETKS